MSTIIFLGSRVVYLKYVWMCFSCYILLVSLFLLFMWDYNISSIKIGLKKKIVLFDLLFYTTLYLSMQDQVFLY